MHFTAMRTSKEVWMYILYVTLYFLAPVAKVRQTLVDLAWLPQHPAWQNVPGEVLNTPAQDHSSDPLCCIYNLRSHLSLQIFHYQQLTESLMAIGFVTRVLMTPVFVTRVWWPQFSLPGFLVPLILLPRFLLPGFLVTQILVTRLKVTRFYFRTLDGSS